MFGLYLFIQVMNTGKQAADVTLLFTWAVSESYYDLFLGRISALLKFQSAV